MSLLQNVATKKKQRDAVGFTPLLTVTSSDHSYTSYVYIMLENCIVLFMFNIMSYLDWH